MPVHRALALSRQAPAAGRARRKLAAIWSAAARTSGKCRNSGRREKQDAVDVAHIVDQARRQLPGLQQQAAHFGGAQTQQVLLRPGAFDRIQPGQAQHGVRVQQGVTGQRPQGGQHDLRHQPARVRQLEQLGQLETQGTRQGARIPDLLVTRLDLGAGRLEGRVEHVLHADLAHAVHAEIGGRLADAAQRLLQTVQWRVDGRQHLGRDLRFAHHQVTELRRAGPGQELRRHQLVQCMRGAGDGLQAGGQRITLTGRQIGEPCEVQRLQGRGQHAGRGPDIGTRR